MAGRPFRGFARDRNGASALEFALLAPLFFTIVLSTFDAGWLMIRSTLLDRAVSETVRRVRTADAAAPKTQDAFKRAVCDTMEAVVPDCLEAITVEMTEVASVADFPGTAATCVNRGASVQPTVAFKAGDKSVILYVRVCAIVDPFTPGLGLALALEEDARGGYRLVTTTAFLTEP